MGITQTHLTTISSAKGTAANYEYLDKTPQYHNLIIA